MLPLMTLEMQEMKKIAVYGSLRQGMYNHPLLGESKLLVTTEVNLPFKMVSLGSFPALKMDNELHPIVIEIYEVDEPTYKRVERLEGYPNFYDKFSFLYDNEDVEIYYIQQEAGNVLHIKDWVKYQNE